MRVLICGDRHWESREIIRAWIAKLQDQGFTTVIEGEANGADTIAGEEAHRVGMEVIRVPAEWERYGRSAGPIRNTKMLTFEPKLVVAFHDNLVTSKGTKNMVGQANNAGIETIVVDEHGRIVTVEERSIALISRPWPCDLELAEKCSDERLLNVKKKNMKAICISCLKVAIADVKRERARLKLEGR